MNSPVVITGASGLIGRMVAGQMTRRGVAAISIGRSDPALPGVAHRAMSLHDEAGLRDIAALRPRAIISFASAVPGAAADLHEAITRDASLRLLALAARIGGCRFITFGSAAEYGPTGGGAALAEDAERRPVSAYGRAKALLMDAVARASASGQDAQGLRLFSVVGAGMGQHTLAGRVWRQIADPSSVAVSVGCLDGARDMSPVNDVAERVTELALRPGPLPAWINLGSGRATPLRDFVAEMIRQGGRPLALQEGPVPPGLTAGGDIFADPALLNRMGLSLPAASAADLACAALGRPATAGRTAETSTSGVAAC